MLCDITTVYQQPHVRICFPAPIAFSLLGGVQREVISILAQPIRGLARKPLVFQLPTNPHLTNRGCLDPWLHPKLTSQMRALDYFATRHRECDPGLGRSSLQPHGETRLFSSLFLAFHVYHLPSSAFPFLSFPVLWNNVLFSLCLKYRSLENKTSVLRTFLWMIKSAMLSWPLQGRRNLYTNGTVLILLCFLAFYYV